LEIEALVLVLKALYLVASLASETVWPASLMKTLREVPLAIAEANWILALQRGRALKLPSVSTVRARMSPVQETGLYSGMYASTLVASCELGVARPDSFSKAVLLRRKASATDVCRAVESFAAKYWPRELMAACHKSSILLNDVGHDCLLVIRSAKVASL
jgi:hypothetical protein